MTALVLFDVHIEDRARYEDYLAATRLSLRGVEFERVTVLAPARRLEGDREWGEIVILRFPSEQAALSWYESPAYQAARRIREECSEAVGCIALEADEHS